MEKRPQTGGERQRGQVRLAAGVVIVTMLVWVAVQALGGHLGWPVRFVFLFDLAALAAFTWALIVLARVWRARRRDGA